MIALEILLDAILAFLCCVGLWTIGQMIFIRLFSSDMNILNDLTLKDEAEQWMKQNLKTK